MKTIKNTLYLGAIASMVMSFAPQASADSSAHKSMKQHGQESVEHEAVIDKNEMATDTKIDDLKYLEHAENKYICMVNNKRFDSAQIPTEVNGKTYYGCCEMCKAKLEGSQELREATDPVSKNVVDKATAIIGIGPDDTAYYFENEKNMKKFDASQALREASHDDHKH